MKRGFTLVELSIVLVIVGLLIGGILAAQSMITTARDQSIIRDMERYRIAIRLFENQYGYCLELTTLLNTSIGQEVGVELKNGLTMFEQMYNMGMLDQKYNSSILSSGYGTSNNPAVWPGKAIPQLSNGQQLWIIDGLYNKF